MDEIDQALPRQTLPHRLVLDIRAPDRLYHRRFHTRTPKHLAYREGSAACEDALRNGGRRHSEPTALRPRSDPEAALASQSPRQSRVPPPKEAMGIDLGIKGAAVTSCN